MQWPLYLQLCYTRHKQMHISTWKLNHPDRKFHGANMGPTWVLSAPDGPHVGPINLAFRTVFSEWQRGVGVDCFGYVSGFVISCYDSTISAFFVSAEVYFLLTKSFTKYDRQLKLWLTQAFMELSKWRHISIVAPWIKGNLTVCSTDCRGWQQWK